ncbi:hypothetical protein ACFP7A_06465 [Sporolactobacillus kofuensis]|uniref:TetR family transcriptional regulator n=1 Tax=Sporolactobacillus kofuensis TaxID=269672 RepID=A0ABW1WCD1_9BACL|nr:hypothetical protein [Sporolactobacillus kofuensis]MCO7175451.1 hypothetical protein [Sporolactobacillus kofuensis]
MRGYDGRKKGDAHIGDPAVDLSIVYSFLPRIGRELFYSQYGEADASTRVRARWKAIFTTVSLLMYGHDLKNQEIVDGGKQSLDLILES